MPLLKEWNISNHGLAAIWKIEEDEAFFRGHTGIEVNIKNDKRRIEHLAGRFLLRHLEEDFPLHNIMKDEHDKPRVDDNEYYFSISHSWPYIAAVIDPHEEAGIDIQTWRPGIGDVKHKFLSPEEQELFGNDTKLLTLAWSSKEAVYKWHGKKGVSFIKQLPIEHFNNVQDKYNIVIYSKLSKVPQMIFIENIINTDFVCSYVLRAQDWAIY